MCREDEFLIDGSSISFYLFLTPIVLNRAILLCALGAAFQGFAHTGEDRYVQWQAVCPRPAASPHDLDSFFCCAARGHVCGRTIAGADGRMADPFARRATYRRLGNRVAAFYKDPLAHTRRFGSAAGRNPDPLRVAAGDAREHRDHPYQDGSRHLQNWSAQRGDWCASLESGYQ